MTDTLRQQLIESLELKEGKSGASADAEQALVSDQAATHLDPSGFDPSRDDYPAYIRNNPIMQGAFAAFMTFAWRQEGMHKAHCEATGMSPFVEPSSAIERMIDESTGHGKAYADSFFNWAVDTQWGVEGRDDQDAQP